MTISLIRFLIFTFLLVNASAGQNKGQKQQPRAPRAISTSVVGDRWYTLMSPDKDIVIQFPSKPDHAADDEAPGGTSRNYILLKDDIVFKFTFIDTGLEPNSQEGNQLPLSFRKEMLNHARERGWTMIRSELLSMNMYEQETWSPIKRNPRQKLHYIERNIVRYGRLYTLTCASVIPDQKADSASCSRFFNSFRVIGAPKPQ